MWLTVVPLPGIGNSRSGIWRGRYFDEDSDDPSDGDGDHFKVIVNILIFILILCKKNYVFLHQTRMLYVSYLSFELALNFNPHQSQTMSYLTSALGYSSFQPTSFPLSQTMFYLT